jgi:hypothetical protein
MPRRVAKLLSTSSPVEVASSIIQREKLLDKAVGISVPVKKPGVPVLI